MAPRVMVIAYDQALTQELANVLRGFGYDVIVVAPDRLTAIWEMPGKESNAILIDVPQHQQQEVLDVAWKIYFALPVPIILITPTPLSSDLDHPAFLYLVKPLAPESLKSIIDTIIEIRQQERLCQKNKERLRRDIATLEDAQRLAKVGHWEEDLISHDLRISPECYKIHAVPPSPPPTSATALFVNVNADDIDSVYRLLKRAREVGTSYEVEYRVARPGQPERTVHQRVVVHRDHEGRPVRLLAAVLDITERRRVENELRQSEQWASQLLRERDFILENTRDVLYYIDRNWNIYYISPSVAQITGYSVDEWKGPFIAHLVDTPNNRRAVAETVEILRTGRTYPPSDIDIRHKNGSIIIAEVNEQPIIADNRVTGIVGVARDVTERRRAERRLRQAAAVFDNMLEAVIITDSDRRIAAVNRSFVTITGYEEDETSGELPDFLSSSTEENIFRERIWNEVAQTGRWAGEVWNRRKSGEAFPTWTSVSAIQDDTGNITNYMALFSDLSRIKESEEELDRLAHYDPLTRLPNRLLFNSRLQHAIRSADRLQQDVAVLFIDLDHFKEVNDTFGHPAGDRLLQVVARDLIECLRKEDTVAHIGGDEFVIILENFKDERYVANVAEKILSVIQRPHTLNGHDIVITASIGISLYPGDGTDVTRLIANADTAMYRAKELGRGRFQFYTAELTNNAIERMTLANALRNALAKNEFILYYQPQFSLETNSITGVEALIRWIHPERGVVLPSAFISLCEETGIIVTVGEWVLRTACTHAKEWKAAGAKPFRIGVNLSALQLTREARLVEQVARILQDTGVDPQQIEFEITESAIMRNAEEAAAMLKDFKALGVRLTIDDFGTGYSSMNYLKTFAVDRLKVDSSFVHDLSVDTNNKAIVRAIIALGHSLQMNVIAEGVETLMQRNFLSENGCDEIQGFIFYPPLTEPECREILLQR